MVHVSVSAHRKGSLRKKELPVQAVQGSRTLAKLFQEAWKKGAEVQQVCFRNFILTSTTMCYLNYS